MTFKLAVSLKLQCQVYHCYKNTRLLIICLYNLKVILKYITSCNAKTKKAYKSFFIRKFYSNKYNLFKEKKMCAKN